MTPQPDRSVRIGAQVAPQHAEYADLRGAVRRLEDEGVDAVFNWDHFFPLTGDPDGKHFEAWTTLAAIAEQTSRIEFGPLVNCTGYRNADLQADMARTIDHISAHGTGTGRFILGTGAGWYARDYREYGYDFGAVGSRLDALAADVPRIKARWEALNPAPTRRIPLLIGGSGEQRTLRIVAEHADIWHSFADPDTLVHKLGVLTHWCERLGRDIGEIEISTGTGIRGQGSLDPAVLDVQYELGVRLFIAVIEGPGYDLEPVRSLLAWRDSRGV